MSYIAAPDIESSNTQPELLGKIQLVSCETLDTCFDQKTNT